jgi:hypothetical protein
VRSSVGKALYQHRLYTLTLLGSVPMLSIDVRHLCGEKFAVTIDEGGSKSQHEVTATAAQVDRLAPGGDPADLVEASIRFLLQREPKESILSRFDLDTISRFFSEYERQVGEFL